MMANLIDFLPDATFAINRENKVISWNRMMEITDRDTCQCYFGNRKLCAGPLTV